jgi:glycosyltransferase involved in cell wall biosynthesis
VKVDLRGAIPASEVAKTLAAESFDLFINTSISEGVPVSVMEAFAAGIPAYATDVGGTREIVDDSVGKLMPSTIDETSLASEIEEFFSLPEARKLEMRDNAFRRFQERCDAKANAEKLAKLLVTAAKRSYF